MARHIARVSSIFRHVLTVILIGAAYWNIWTFVHSVAHLPGRDADDMVVLEGQYRPIRDALVAAGYRKGPVRFMTRRELKGEPSTEEDKERWAKGQYVMVPWILLRDRRPVTGPEFSADASFVIGDFWDGAPAEIPQDLVPLHDTGRGLILYQRKSAP